MREWTLALGVGVTALTSQAHAKEPLLLSYRAPTSCPSATEFRENVRSLLKDPETTEGAFAVSVAIQPREDQLALHLQLPHTTRELEGASCDDLVNAAALVVALALEDPALQSKAKPPPEEHAEDEAQKEPSPPDPAEPTAPSAIYFGAALGIDTGSLPQPGPIASFRAGYLSEHYLIEGRLLGAFPQQAQVSNTRTLDTALFGGAVSACHLPPRLGFGFFTLCLGLSGGALFASSPEILTAGEAAPAFFNADLGGGFWWMVEEGFAVTLGAELSQPLLVPAIYLRGGEEPVLAHRAGTTFRGLGGMRLLF